MTFGDALEKMKAGRYICRPDWPAGTILRCAYTDEMQAYVEFVRDGIAIPYVVGNNDLFAFDWKVALAMGPL